MLSTIAIIFAVLLVGAALVQEIIAISFKRVFLKRESTVMPSGKQELAVVVMSVRGCDPSLRASLAGILSQDYENYEVHLIVDNRSDRAWDFVHQVKSELDHRDVLTIHELQAPLETCSLKCHSIVQALGQIPAETKYVALLDADVTPHKTWLAELTGPLLDPEVGGVTGNQWFEPRTPAGVGSLTRSGWNGGALVITIFFSNPWAGSFAMRAEDLDASGLIDTWRRSVVDDGPIKNAIHGLGKRIEFAPSLIMINRESCTFSYVHRWVTRMLTWSRLYEKTFFWSVIHAAFSNFVMLSNFAVLLIAIVMGHSVAILITAIGLVVSGLLSAMAYVASRQCVAKSCELRGETFAPLSPGRFVGVLLVVAVGQMIYGISCARAILLKQIRWREITYEVKRHDQIKRLNYQPYLPGESQSKVSI